MEMFFFCFSIASYSFSILHRVHRFNSIHAITCAASMPIQSIKTQVIRHPAGSKKEKEISVLFSPSFFSYAPLEKFKEMCCIIYGCFSLPSSSLSLQMPMPLEEKNVWIYQW